MPGRRQRWLLIGNSRWHWAEIDAGPDRRQKGLLVRHRAPEQGVEEVPAAWAAVGPVPAGAGLPAARRLRLEDVPLGGCPPWLGIDRALAGWRAFHLAGGPVLVADAGTVLSLTRVDGRGQFAGGRLMAGGGLQLWAMTAGTEALPAVEEGLVAAGCTVAWPRETVQAMRIGVAEGLAAAVLAAARQAREEDGCRLVLTGGDGPALLPLLQRPDAWGNGRPMEVGHHPDLCLEALVALRPPPEAAPGDGPCEAPAS